MRVYCLLACLLAASGLDGADVKRAEVRFKDAQKAERKGELVRAYLLYSEAAAFDPSNLQYWLRAKTLETRASAYGKKKAGEPPVLVGAPADAALKNRKEEAEAPETEPVTEAELAEARQAQPPLEVKTGGERRSFDIRGDARALFQQVARLYGLDVVFDWEYAAGPRIHFQMEAADHREALRALEAATGSFVAPVNERMLLVAKDTPQKRSDLEPTASLTVPLPEPVSVQEVQEIVRGVQQVMNLTRITVDSVRRIVLMRDRVSKLLPARALFEELLRHRAQVAVELEFIELTKSAGTEYGLSLPSLFPIVNFGDFGHSTPSIPSGFVRFLTFGAGSSFLGLGVTDAGMIARMDRSHARTLLRSEIRSVDGQPASLHVGDRYPIITGAFVGQVQGAAASIPPAFNFEDLGILVKITPHVHGAGEISLDVEAEFKVLTGAALNSIPVVANRKLQSTVRLAANQWAMVAGLVNVSGLKTVSGPAGLATLPFLGALFRETTLDKTVGDIVILLKPTLLSFPPGYWPSREVRTGSDTRPVTPL